MRLPLPRQFLRDTVLRLPRWRLWLIAAFASLTWSLVLTNDWGPDFGVYYVSARFMSEDYGLYREIFTHKGPVYYVFLRMLGAFIGWGGPQAVASLALTAFLFLGAIVAISGRAKLDSGRQMLLLLAGCALFYGQPSNASIAVFMSALLLCSFYLVVQSMQTRGGTSLYVAVLLWAVAVFTRLDAAGFFPLFVGAWLYHLDQRVKFSWAFGALVAVVSVGVVFGTLAVLLRFDLAQFIHHNITFNNFYRKEVIGSSVSSLVRAFSRSESLAMLIVSGMPLLVAALLGDWIRQRRSRDPRRLVALSVLILSVIIWLYSGSDRDYHLWILYPGSVLVLAMGLSNVVVSRRIIAIANLYLALVVGSTLGPNLMAAIRQIRSGVFLEPPSLERPMIQEMKIQPYAVLVGNWAWVYLFAERQPDTATNNFWFYRRGFATEGLSAQHHQLLERLRSHPGSAFWVRRDLSCSRPQTSELRDLLSLSVMEGACDDQPYQRWRIKTTNSVPSLGS